MSGRDSRPHVEALVATVTAAIAPRTAYARGDVPGMDGNPGVEPDIYAIVDLERRSGGVDRAGGAPQPTLWRCWIRIVAKSANEVRWGTARVTEALEDQAITVDGRGTSGFVFGTDDEPAPDGGRVSGATSWHYAH